MKRELHPLIRVVRIVGALIIMIGTSSPVLAASGPDLAISVAHDGGDFVQGEQYRSYTITVTNNGDVATSGTITVTDSVPAGLTPWNISGTDWTCPLQPLSAAPVTLTCTRTTPLAGGGTSSTITFVTDVDVNAGNVGTEYTVPTIPDPDDTLNTYYKTETLNVTVSGGGDTGADPDATDFEDTPIVQKSDLRITGYKFLSYNKSEEYSSSNILPNTSFWVRMTIENRGGLATGSFYPGVFIDGKNYGPDHDPLGQPTTYSDFKRSATGCMYYDPSGTAVPPLPDTERGNYTLPAQIPDLAAGTHTDVDVLIGYPDEDPYSHVSFPIYDTDGVRNGLSIGSYQMHLYADPNCLGRQESFEDNNVYPVVGAITVNVGQPIFFGPLTLWSTDFSYYPQGWRADLHPRVTGDVNGDNKDDVIGFGYGGVLVALSNGNGFDPASLWTSDFSYNQGWRMDTYPRMVGDVNGDGNDDVVGFGYAGTVVALSNGSNGFGPLTLWTSDFSYAVQGWRANLHPRVMGDVNGDHMDDVIGFGYGGVMVALSNGSGFDPVSLWTGDFGFNQGWRMDMYPRMVGDVNGDGNDDVVGFGYAGTAVALSNGSNGFGPLTLWSSDFSYAVQGWRADLHPRVTGDVNGDNMDDVIGFGYGGVMVALSNGHGFDPVSLWTGDFGFNQGWRMDTYPRMVGDVDGDGYDDVVGFGYAGTVVGLAR